MSVALRELPLVALLGVTLLAVLGGAEALRARHGWPAHDTRTLVHVACGLVAAGLPWLLDSPLSVLLLAAGFFALMLVSRRRRRLRAVHAVGRRTDGGLYFPSAVALTFALAHERPAAYSAALLVLALGDAAAGLVGRRFGRRRYRLGAGPKSLEGSLALVAVSAPAVLMSLCGLAGLSLGEACVWAVVVSALCALLEAAAPAGSDNLLLPLAAAFVLSEAHVARPERLDALALALCAALVLGALLATLPRLPAERAGRGGRGGLFGVRGSAWAELARGGSLC